MIQSTIFEYKVHFQITANLHLGGIFYDILLLFIEIFTIPKKFNFFDIIVVNWVFMTSKYVQFEGTWFRKTITITNIMTELIFLRNKKI